MSSSDQPPAPPQPTPQSEQDPFAVRPTPAGRPSQGKAQGQVRYAPPSSENNAGMRLVMPIGRSGWAIAAGYLGLFGLIIFPAPLALIASILAIRDINRSKKTDNPKYGMGRAIFGLIVGVVGSALLLLLLLFVYLADNP